MRYDIDYLRGPEPQHIRHETTIERKGSVIVGEVEINDKTFTAAVFSPGGTYVTPQDEQAILGELLCKIQVHYLENADDKP